MGRAVTYISVLETIQADNVILEIGAGDLRRALQIASIARQVFAIEIHSEIIDQALSNYPCQTILQNVLNKLRKEFVYE